MKITSLGIDLAKSVMKNGRGVVDSECGNLHGGSSLYPVIGVG